MNLIKQKYERVIVSYGNIVKDIAYTSKFNPNESINVVMKRSKPDEPLILSSKDFKDMKFKELFISDAKLNCVWYDEIEK